MYCTCLALTKGTFSQVWYITLKYPVFKIITASAYLLVCHLKVVEPKLTKNYLRHQ